ncbi:MAG: hypothetical protein GX320_05235 [Tissierellia bacterium]|nr:hypothetical protein [Tissierellia bacterium]
MNFTYPELYYRIYPKVMDTIGRYLDNNEYMENLTEEDIIRMTDEVYEKMVIECPEIHEDPVERRGQRRYRKIQRVFYGRRRLVRDIITIILISELLRRRNPHVTFL